MILITTKYLGLVKEKGKWGIVVLMVKSYYAPAYKSLDASSKKDGTFFVEEGKIKFLTLKAMVLY